ncbi:MAG TPA: Rrf2 family transcriptional regulator [Planctomycetota bacterium]|nr:Rrf2 family transcriptional regulator [Planctomycetota bacterium]
MLNLTKRVDYGLIALTHLACVEKTAASTSPSAPGRLSVRGVAEAYNMSQPLLANVMKDLARLGFVRSVRGTKGGYELAFPPEQLTVGRVAEALEGPLRLTECVNHQAAESAESASCSVFESCLIKRSLFLVHTKIRDALYGVTIADLARNAGPLRHAPSTSGRLPVIAENAQESTSS